MEQSNTQCNRCMAGRNVTYCVRETRDFHIRYLKCNRCGRTAKQTLPHAEVHRRSPRVQLGNAPASGDSRAVRKDAVRSYRIYRTTTGQRTDAAGDHQ